ncbi:MAG: 2-dehydro-3-deoxyphosphogluconate aldolase [Spirochaetales bacterium]|nr:2-dehydro-3-deoxyphosphogluconate aldolase [Spirochaetales bacterium]
MDVILETLESFRLIPVVKIERAEDVIPLGKALLDAGLPVVEITFRTAAAEKAISLISKTYPELLVGAGTVLKVLQVQRAVDAGAKFIVSPGFNPKTVGYCLENGYTVTPGINSPTQIEMALELGLEVLKFFPAQASGGTAMLKAMSAPFGDVRFIPTGGISADNVMEYLSLDCVLACGGSWMVKSDLIKNGKFAEIRNICAAAVEIVTG